jgi:hypothetical protein
VKLDRSAPPYRRSRQSRDPHAIAADAAAPLDLAFLIKLDSEGVSMWLKSRHPILRWGPRENAKRFRTKGEATAALRQLPVRVGRSAKIEPDLRPPGSPVS